MGSQRSSFFLCLELFSILSSQELVLCYSSAIANCAKNMQILRKIKMRRMRQHPSNRSRIVFLLHCWKHSTVFQQGINEDSRNHLCSSIIIAFKALSREYGNVHFLHKTVKKIDNRRLRTGVRHIRSESCNVNSNDNSKLDFIS